MSYESDDDDYELPSLSERIAAAIKPKEMMPQKNSLSCKDEESEFPKFKEDTPVKDPIYITPLKAPNVFSSDLSTSEDDSPFLILSEKVNKISISAAKTENCSSTTLDGGDNESLKSSQKIYSTPSVASVVYSSDLSTSEDDSPFLILSENVNKISISAAKTDIEHCEKPDREDESEFLKFSEKIRNTPYTPKVIKHCKVSDTEDESEFLKFSEKIRNTPYTPKVNEKDSGGSPDFLKIVEKIRNTPRVSHTSENDSGNGADFLKKQSREFFTPRSQNKNAKKNSDVFLTPDPPEKKKLFMLNSSKMMKHESTTLTKSTENYQKEAELEFESKFPLKSEIMINKGNREKYAKQLYDFFNRVIFASKLPEDMALIWDGLLISTAGKTFCQKENHVKNCYIKLSSKILTTFDRLQDTLLHEMCHLAVFVVNGRVDEQHGALWHTWATRCNIIMPSIKCPSRCHNYEVEKRVLYKCTSCGFEIRRCKQSQKLGKAVCNKCSIPFVTIIK